jgi:hypothetical protein
LKNPHPLCAELKGVCQHNERRVFRGLRPQGNQTKAAF